MGDPSDILLPAITQLGGVGALAIVVWIELRKLREAFEKLAQAMAQDQERGRADSASLSRIESRLRGGRRGKEKDEP